MNDMSFPIASHLDAWFSQKPTLALMGEFSAGKSTLLNLILGENLLQTRVTATNMPVIWMTYGDAAKAEYLTRDGLLEPFALEDLNAQGDKNHQLIRLSLPADLLKSVDVIDTPGISDGRLEVGALDFLGPYLDFVIWCSAANQAWRQTEKSMWQRMPMSLREKSILALTRADTLKKETDLQKVIRRCEAETADLFSRVLPISALRAVDAKNPESPDHDAEAWRDSHAPAFMAALSDGITDAGTACDARETIEVPKAVPTAEEITPVGLKTVTSSETKPIKTADKADNFHNAAEVSDLVSELCLLLKTNPEKDQFVSNLSHTLTSFRSQKNLSEGQQMILDLTLPLDRSETTPPALIVAQLIRELDDFATTTWHAVDHLP